MTKLTRAQRKAVYRKYCENADGCSTYREFRKRVTPAGFGDYVMLDWCGMMLGIERDGYTHS